MSGMESRRNFVLKAVLAIMMFAFLLTVATPYDAKAQQELTVSAAASLTNAFKEIGTSFEASQANTTKAKVLMNFASSGALMQQIAGGAPVDVFASAAQREMNELEKKGLVIVSTRRDFAANGIVLIKPASSKAALKGFGDLKNAGIKKIAIGNPASVPAGMYAQEALKYFRIYDDIKDKLIFGEHVRQVLDYVARGEVDAGIVFSTDAMVRSKEVTIVAPAPDKSHKKILYPVAVVKDSKKVDLSKSFIDFLVSPEGKKILAKYGFTSAN
jgi:molybdate transport system substrate-binding protein